MILPLKTLALVAVLITSVVVYQTASVHQQFYPTVVKLLTQKVSKIVLVYDGIIGTVLAFNFVVWLFFGALESREEEESWERSSVSVIETCLALTVFREETTFWVFFMFVVCLFMKNFHWISQLRVQHMESINQTSFGDFGRLYCLLAILLGLDTLFIMRYTSNLMDSGISVKSLFLTEFLIMSVVSIAVITRLTLHTINVSNPNFVNHDDYVYYLEIVSDLLQSSIYIAFFLVIMSKYGIPIHLVRDMYMTIKSAHKRIMDFINYRNMISKLERLYPNATPDELLHAQQSGTTCTFCRQQMENAKKMPCGHLYHSKCLRGWIEEHNDCPICHAPVDPDQYPIYKRQQQQQQQRTVQVDQQQQVQHDEELIPELQQFDPDTLNQLYQLFTQQQTQQSQQQTQSDNTLPQVPHLLTHMQTRLGNMPNPADFFSSMYLHQQHLNEQFGEAMDPRVNDIVRKMYIKYLETVQVLVIETLQQLHQVEQPQ